MVTSALLCGETGTCPTPPTCRGRASPAPATRLRSEAAPVSRNQRGGGQGSEPGADSGGSRHRGPLDSAMRPARFPCRPLYPGGGNVNQQALRLRLLRNMMVGPLIIYLPQHDLLRRGQRSVLRGGRSWAARHTPARKFSTKLRRNVTGIAFLWHIG